jgi:2-amino-4-hydroxy-6-hydroxymethyldihydropteridine diphosphokinase
MARVFIGIGSNVGDRQGFIDLARAELAKLPDTLLVKFSGVYETPPVGPVEQGPFLNAAAELRSYASRVLHLRPAAG